LELPSCSVANPPVVRAGSSGSISVKGLSPNSQVTVSLPGVALGGGTTDAHGEGTFRFFVPSNTRPGRRVVAVASPNGEISAFCSLLVGSDATVPSTLPTVLPAPNSLGRNEKRR
jgi:hypothetical protein